MHPARTLRVGLLLAVLPSLAVQSGGRTTLPETETALRMKVAGEVLIAHLEVGPLPDTAGGLIEGRDLLPRSSVFGGQLPLVDGWRHPLSYWSDGWSFVVVSPGNNGRLDREYEFSRAWSFLYEPDAEIDDFLYASSIFSNGALFVQRPMTAEERIEDTTVRQMRRLAVAVYTFVVDEKQFPALDADGPVPVTELDALLVPVYVHALPERDGWGHPLLYWSNGLQYAIVSVGSDGEPDDDYGQLLEPGPCGGYVSDSAQDMVLVNGRFCQWRHSRQRPLSPY